VKAFVFILGAVASLAAGAGTPDGTPDLFPSLQQATIRASTAGGTRDFRVWIAADDKSRERGLMFVRDLPPDRGMLFVFEFPQPVAFWMKNTYLSLDLVFIDAEGKVLNVAANAKPLSLEPIQSRGDAIAVLEVRGGTARRIGLGAGDRVSLPTLPTTGGAANPPVSPPSVESPDL
jgi:uncharacterized membrane protein (UPF0127 family)